MSQYSQELIRITEQQIAYYREKLAWWESSSEEEEGIRERAIEGLREEIQRLCSQRDIMFKRHATESS